MLDREAVHIHFRFWLGDMLIYLLHLIITGELHNQYLFQQSNIKQFVKRVLAFKEFRNICVFAPLEFSSTDFLVYEIRDI